MRRYGAYEGWSGHHRTAARRGRGVYVRAGRADDEQHRNRDVRPLRHKVRGHAPRRGRGLHGLRLHEGDRPSSRLHHHVRTGHDQPHNRRVARLQGPRARGRHQRRHRAGLRGTGRHAGVRPREPLQADHQLGHAGQQDRTHPRGVPQRLPGGAHAAARPRVRQHTPRPDGRSRGGLGHPAARELPRGEHPHAGRRRGGAPRRRPAGQRRASAAPGGRRRHRVRGHG